jgi:hypothetical protein
MVAVIEQKNPPIEKHHHFIPVTYNNIYNCELCGVRIALLKAVSSTSAYITYTLGYKWGKG